MRPTLASQLRQPTADQRPYEMQRPEGAISRMRQLDIQREHHLQEWLNALTPNPITPTISPPRPPPGYQEPSPRKVDNIPTPREERPLLPKMPQQVSLIESIQQELFSRQLSVTADTSHFTRQTLSMLVNSQQPDIIYGPQADSLESDV
ncbi:hypothetical protein N7532_006743 [Penicillium argentinense]|uniref:Uncharacterized protein n=1 Tax=Penicillium argentinense TaxID=1131581 RepID=A0A9W9FGU6_9EURO|nr:uncharacterized protein N7532_006743 [Penicillium argentinense]KAJ5099742.1 hypothetical protein N7532_006743 [Penicillium argentinense]